jgi:hypothetical protein
MNDLPDWCCPSCGWNSENLYGLDDAPVTYSEPVANLEYGEHWDETWTCPVCGEVWTWTNWS